MKVRHVVPLLGLCLLVSCRRSEPASEPARETFLELGGTSLSEPGKPYALRSYAYQKGDRLAVAVFVEAPKKPAGPAFVVLARLPNRELIQPSGRSGSGDPRLSWAYRFASPGGAACEVNYELKGDPEAEHWLIDGKSFAVAAGRVALADLTKSPVEVSQVGLDLLKVFATPHPNQAQMKEGLDKLRERDEGARKFLE